MTAQEARLLLRSVIERLDVMGSCKWLSAGADACVCAKCQIERMPIGELLKEVRSNIDPNPES